RLRLVARLEMPCLLELHLALLREAELFGAFPGLSQVARAVHGRAVDEIVRAGVERAVAGIDERVEDVPACQQRPFDLPVAPALVAVEEEQALSRSCEAQRAHVGEEPTAGPRSSVEQPKEN